MHPTNRLPNLRSRAFAAAGVATLGLSLLMAIAPAVAKSDNANSGTVKVHAVGEPADNGPDSANDPHVCQFWLGFYFAPDDGGTWDIQPWSDGSDAPPAIAGSYDTVAGFASTDALWLAPGHYKLFWLGTNDHNWKHKAFWVDEPCPDPSIVGSGDVPGDVSPGDDPGDVGAGDDPADDPGDINPGDDPGDVGDDPGDETPGDVPGDVSPGDETPGDVPGDVSPGDETHGDVPGDVNPGDDPGDESPGDVPGDVNPGDDPGDVPGDVNPGDDPGDETPGDVPGDVNPGDDSSDDPADQVPPIQEPRQGTQDSTSSPATHPSASAPAVVAAHSPSTVTRSNTLPDTSTGSNAMFVTAAGLLMLVVAHRLRRREGALILG